MRNQVLASIVGAALSVMATWGSFAADMAPDMAAVEEPPLEIGWSFTTAAYLWASGIDGDVGLFGLPPQAVDVSFKDIFTNLNGAFMAVGEARNGPFSVGVDLMYAAIGASVDTPFGILANSIDVDVVNATATVVGGYALIDDGTLRLDAVAGARLWYSDNDFTFIGNALNGTSRDDGDTWIDPLIGTKFRVGLGGNAYASGWAMVGGFGVASDFMWDVMGGVGYQFTDHFSAFAGYRAMGVDYSNDGFVYDVIQHGPVLAGVFRF
jgi:hypothetical protein